MAVPLVVCVWGGIGPGKSRLMHKLFPDAHFLRDRRFKTYKGEAVVVVENFPGNMGRDEFTKQFLAGAPPTVNLIVLLSLYPPVEWYGCMMPEIEAALYYDGTEAKTEKIRNFFGVFTPRPYMNSAMLFY